MPQGKPTRVTGKPTSSKKPVSGFPYNNKGNSTMNAPKSNHPYGKKGSK